MKTEVTAKLASDVTGRNGEARPQSEESMTEDMLDLLWEALIETIRARAMPYRIKFGNHLVEADTPNEVCQLLNQLGADGTGAVVELPNAREPADWTRMGVGLLMERIDSRRDQRQLLLRLYTHKHETGWLKEELVAVSKMSAQQLGGVLAGLAKNAKRIGRRPAIKVEHIQLRGRRTCRYRLDENFRRILGQIHEQERRDYAGSADLPPVPRGLSTGPPVPNGER